MKNVKMVMCDACGVEIEEDESKEGLGNTLCKDCYPEVALDKCDVCGEPLEDHEIIRDELNNLLCSHCHKLFLKEKEEEQKNIS